MTPQHTPEPWVIDETDFDIVAITDDLNVYVNGTFDSISKPDLRRIVACVNACAGVDTETLIAMANGEMTGSEIWELPRVKAERDRLASELNTAKLAFIESCEQYDELSDDFRSATLERAELQAKYDDLYGGALRQSAVVVDLREALVMYGRHRGTCNSGNITARHDGKQVINSCNCGLNEAIDKAGEVG